MEQTNESGREPLVQADGGTQAHETNCCREAARLESDQLDVQEELAVLLKKQVRFGKITAACSIFCMICMLTVTGILVSFVPQLRSSLRDMNKITSELSRSSKDLSGIISSLNERGLNELYQTLQNIQKIDIEKLNESIDSLNGVVRPLARLFRTDGD